MKRKLSILFAALMILAVMLPTNAGTWRSSSGNMFHFYPGGSLQAYTQDGNFSGCWWWTSSPYQFQYSVRGVTHTVNIKGQGAVCQAPGMNPTYWQQIASRGGDTDKPDTTSWFVEQIDP